MVFHQALARKILARTAPVLFLYMLVLLSPGVETALAQIDPAAEALAAAQTDSDSLAQIWSTRTSDLAALVDEAATLKDLAEDLAAPLSDRVAEARTQMARLSGLFQVSRGHPTEQLALRFADHAPLLIRHRNQPATDPLDTPVGKDSRPEIPPSAS